MLYIASLVIRNNYILSCEFNGLKVLYMGGQLHAHL